MRDFHTVGLLSCLLPLTCLKEPHLLWQWYLLSQHISLMLFLCCPTTACWCSPSSYPAPDSYKLSGFTHGFFQLYMKCKPPVSDRRWDHCSRELIYPKMWLQIRRKYLNLVLQESENKDGESSVQTQLYESSQQIEVKANNEAAKLMAWRPSSWEYGKWGTGRRCLKRGNRDQRGCSEAGFTSCWNAISVTSQRWGVLNMMTWWC